VALAQLGEGDVAADLDAQVEVDAPRLELLPAGEHDLLFQLEVGDAVDHQPADAVVAVIDVDLEAAQPQALGGGEPGRAGADDADAVRQLARRGWAASPSPAPRHSPRCSARRCRW
jgi:hypothetical protein